MKFALIKRALLVLAMGLAVLVFQWGKSPGESGVANESALARSSPELLQPEAVLFSELPTEARRTIALIQSGGPFPYEKDGTVFRNREGLLPKQSRGYYTEYTVPTPGASNRGARRIVAGQGKGGSPASSGEYWYTDDHYRSFRMVRVEQP